MVGGGGILGSNNWGDTGPCSAPSGPQKPVGSIQQVHSLEQKSDPGDFLSVSSVQVRLPIENTEIQDTAGHPGLGLFLEPGVTFLHLITEGDPKWGLSMGVVLHGSKAHKYSETCCFMCSLKTEVCFFKETWMLAGKRK